MIQIEQVTKRYGKTVAVNSLALDVAQGELFAFLGPNGAGKTTTIKMLSGLLRPDEGRIRVGGHDIVRSPETAKAILAYVPDRPFLYEKLTGREYLEFIAELYRVPLADARPRMESWLERFDLEDAADQFIGSYSHGMRQKLVFAGAFLHDPQVYVIDEPLVGLDPASVRKLKDMLCDECARGKTVFLSTHILAVAEELATRIGIIHHGNLLACGSLEEIRGKAAPTTTVNGHWSKLEEIFLQLTSVEEEETHAKAQRRKERGIQ